MEIYKINKLAKLISSALLLLVSDASYSAYIQGESDYYVAFEAENYDGIKRHNGEKDGFNVVSINEFTSDFGSNVLPLDSDFPASEGQALLADFRHEYQQQQSTVEYKLVFNKPGTYRLYYRRALFEKGPAESYGGEDSFYFLSEFGGSNYKQHGGRGDKNSELELHPVNNPSEGNFHWVNTKHNFTVSEEDVGKELSFTIKDREKGFSIDRFVFSTDKGLDINEVGRDGDGNELDHLINSYKGVNNEAYLAYPMEHVPYEESDEEIIARESELFGIYQGFLDYVEQQDSLGNASKVIDELIIENNKQDEIKMALRTLITLSSNEMYYPHWKAEVIKRFREQGEIKRIEAIEKIIANDGKINDLGQTTPIRRYTDYAWGLYALGAFHDDSAESIEFRHQFEEFIHTYVEGVKPYYDNAFYTGGYNKEVLAMDVASTVTLLYRDTQEFPIMKEAFEAFWENVTKTSYENDNSPHYGAGTGFHSILNMALRHGRENDVIHSEHLFRNIDRMARTVMSSGQSAKWGKSAEKVNADQLLIKAGKGLHWDLKLGYKLWKDPFYLYVARKYEVHLLRKHDPFAAEKYHADLWPIGIDALDVELAKPSVEDTPSMATTRITGCSDCLLLARNDSNYVEVQDKLMVSTGHHPRAPYLMMNLSYTQHKAGQDLRLGIDVHNYNGAHTISRLYRWSEANKNNGIYINPSEYVYPNAPYPAKQISYPGYPHEFEEIMGYTQKTGYELDSYGAKQLSKEAAYGFADYEKYQYPGVSAKRQVVLLHNGITVVSDTISTASSYTGGHNGGALYQVLPKLKSEVGDNWVLISNQQKMLPFELPEGEKETVDTLVIFASTPEGTDIRLANNPDDPVNREWLSASKPLTAGETFNIISLLVPVQTDTNLKYFIEGIDVEERNGAESIVRLPYDMEKYIQVSFSSEQEPSFEYIAIN
ncbi:hypothetical protein [Vibrio coralliilyticus]|uniref:hypothetical protein n=1 Tax=Vibrio coralliilyticus TaxID=190893 RepID=UPI000BAADCE8|nr:hypothetical protein [Vibrio coralliilyticus]NOI59008.1 hypothetical protein [Vibrio coralliilyticus]PAT70125.1 hypothetical protein CKA27_05025 [Vibrio coralliilyticus]